MSSEISGQLVRKEKLDYITYLRRIMYKYAKILDVKIKSFKR